MPEDYDGWEGYEGDSLINASPPSPTYFWYRAVYLEGNPLTPAMGVFGGIGPPALIRPVPPRVDNAPSPALTPYWDNTSGYTVIAYVRKAKS